MIHRAGLVDSEVTRATGESGSISGWDRNSTLHQTDFGLRLIIQKIWANTIRRSQRPTEIKLPAYTDLRQDLIIMTGK
jgi:hypothetical protein